jgi:large subunit ribosomal protein L14e
MFEVGRLCVKIAGRDAGKKCVVVDILEKNYVLIDGLTRRRKCNIAHLEPLKETIDIKKKACPEDVIKAFKKLGIEIKPKKSKKPGKKPKKAKVVKKSVEEKAEKKAKKVKAEKKASKKEEINKSPKEEKKEKPAKKEAKPTEKTTKKNE